MREIVLDTETTGLNPFDGHRIVEIGCVELMRGVRTGDVFHCYLNPERDMPEEAYRVHGLSEEFLRNHPLFSEVVDRFLQFIGDAPLVIHNAAFDMKFINAELEKLGFSPIEMSRAVDTVVLARKQFPGAQANLNALCRRFNIDLSGREKHGALLDAELLADVYVELLGGKQTALGLEGSSQDISAPQAERVQTAQARPARQFDINDEEIRAHQELVSRMKNPLWAET